MHVQRGSARPGLRVTVVDTGAPPTAEVSNASRGQGLGPLSPPASAGCDWQGWARAVLTPARPGSQRAAWPLSPQRPASLCAGGGEPATAGRAPSRSRVIGLINLRVRRPG